MQYKLGTMFTAVSYTILKLQPVDGAFLNTSQIIPVSPGSIINVTNVESAENNHWLFAINNMFVMNRKPLYGNKRHWEMVDKSGLLNASFKFISDSGRLAFKDILTPIIVKLAFDEPDWRKLDIDQQIALISFAYDEKLSNSGFTGNHGMGNHGTGNHVS